jgi:hypothetical protein
MNNKSVLKAFVSAAMLGTAVICPAVDQFSGVTSSPTAISAPTTTGTVTTIVAEYRSLRDQLTAIGARLNQLQPDGLASPVLPQAEAERADLLVQQKTILRQMSGLELAIRKAMGMDDSVALSTLQGEAAKMTDRQGQRELLERYRAQKQIVAREDAAVMRELLK